VMSDKLKIRPQGFIITDGDFYLARWGHFNTIHPIDKTSNVGFELFRACYKRIE